MCTKLWTLDVNRLVPGKDYNLDLQGETKVYKREDKAKDPLFLNVNEDKLKKLPTFKGLLELGDYMYYNAHTLHTRRELDSG